jgi:hypothetical protein
MNFKLRVPFSVYRFFRIWRLEYLANKAKKSLDSLRAFTAGHVMEHPYSMVFAALQDRLAEVQYEIMMLEVSDDWERYIDLEFEHAEEKATAEFNAVMKQADDFLRSLGPEFQAKLNEECEGALEEWFKGTNGLTL